MLFLDADLDGRLDLFAANGHLEDDIARVDPSQTYAQPPALFWNAGAGQPTCTSEEAGRLTRSTTTRRWWR